MHRSKFTLALACALALAGCVESTRTTTTRPMNEGEPINTHKGIPPSKQQEDQDLAPRGTSGKVQDKEPVVP